ncbi:MAG: DUF1800 domain-containing protein [Verrucomicrobiota bacterium JB022]|nr:DUF1800 domain-containing protein [Verrucomicrobiota bacterium JB022]
MSDSEIRAFTPAEAWAPLPESQWNEANAAHLLRRLGFAAPPEAVRHAVQTGLPATLKRYLGTALSMPEPESFPELRVSAQETYEGLDELEPREKRMAQRELRRDGREVFFLYEVDWLQFARPFERQPYEKWVLFLQDVFVVGSPKVQDPLVLYAYQELLRQRATGSFGDLCKAVSRSAAMVRYLDLNGSKKDAPNENFARELFELFMLGEGHYTEHDIKEAARAFTGYRVRRDGTFTFARRQHDEGEKTIFGQTGHFDGDAVIDLALQQPAAATFLPGQLAAYYLDADHPLPEAHLQALGEIWRESGFNLRTLADTFFGSQLFYAHQFRGNYIKSPLQFYLGLLTDLELDVPPFPEIVHRSLRGMGQAFFMPPNVRGWVYGRNWINASTLAARRQAVQWVFSPLDEEKMNADDLRRLEEARAAGRSELKLTRERLQPLLKLKDEAVLDHLVERLYGQPLPAPQRRSLLAYLQQPGEKPGRGERIRQLAITLLQGPQYQLC